MSVLPKVIETPKIAAVAKDGIQLIAVCRVTVRTNIDRLVGGAGEETIIATDDGNIAAYDVSYRDICIAFNGGKKTDNQFWQRSAKGNNGQTNDQGRNSYGASKMRRMLHQPIGSFDEDD